jgi:hypothetical protein
VRFRPLWRAGKLILAKSKTNNKQLDRDIKRIRQAAYKLEHKKRRAM